MLVLPFPSPRAVWYNGAGDISETMRPVIFPRRRAALLSTVLVGGLIAAPASAGPLLLSPLLSQPTTVAAALAPAPDFFSPLSFNLLADSNAALAPFAGRTFTTGAAPALSLSEVWRAARQADPSLRLSGWRRLFNVARLGVFVIPLRDDPAERANILLSAQAVDNTSVAPGQVFSFNSVVGERTPEKGYRDGLMFSQGQVVRGTGGGICLVATGLYNAALQSGLQMIERHRHSGLVGYAPPGCDASIVYGSEDMQFRNTTSAPIVVKAQPEDDRVVIGLYGATPLPGRHVYVKATHFAPIHAPTIRRPDPTLAPDAAPVVVQRPRQGFDVTVERFWKQGKRTVRREVVVTEHRDPRPRIVRVPVPLPAPAPVPAVPGAPPAVLPGAPGATPPPPAGVLPVAPALRKPSPPPPALPQAGEGEPEGKRINPRPPAGEGGAKRRVRASSEAGR